MKWMESKDEINSLNSELKMKHNMMASIEAKIKQFEGPVSLADQLLEKIKVWIKWLIFVLTYVVLN